MPGVTRQRYGRGCGTCVSGTHGKGLDREICESFARRRYFVSRDWMRSARNWGDRDKEGKRIEPWGASAFWDSASAREPAKEVENYLAIKRNEVLTHTIVWMNVEKIMLNERDRTQKATILWFHLYKMSRICKSIKTESRLVVVRATGEWGE